MNKKSFFKRLVGLQRLGQKYFHTHVRVCARTRSKGAKLIKL